MSKKRKESRTDWIAVENEFQGSSVKIDKAKSAFQIYQKENTSFIADEMRQVAEEAIEFGAVQKEVSRRVR